MKRTLKGKKRPALTLISIAIGVFSVVLISTISEVGTAEIGKTLAQMGINSVIVQTKTGTIATLDQNDLDDIVQLDGVTKAMPLMAQTTEVRLLDKNQDAYAWGVNKDAKEIISLEAKHGRLITPEDTAKKAMVCVIDEDIAVAAYHRSNIVGKTARVLVGTSYYDFEIVGVARSGISSLQSSLSNFIPQFVYIPISTMQMLSGRSSYDKLAVLIKENADFAVADNIEELLVQQKGKSSVTATSLLQQKNQLDKIISVVTLVLTVIAGISLIVSGLSVMTTMLVSVNERKREIGIKKSIGARNSNIMAEFLSESVVLTLIGSVIGIAAALTIAFIGCLILGVNFIVNIASIITALLVSMLIGIVFGVHPARKAANLPPIEALRG